MAISTHDMRRNDLWLVSLLLLLVVLSFVAASGYVMHRARAIDQAAIQISENAAPSILHLSAARVEVRHLEAQMEHCLDEARVGRCNSLVEIQKSRERLHRDVALYKSMPEFPGEDLLWQSVSREFTALDARLVQFVALTQAGRLEDAESLLHGGLLQGAILKTVNSFIEIIELNAHASHDLATQIRAQRARLERSSLILNVLCVLWTLAAAFVIGWNIRRQSQLRDAQHRLATERAEELEQFAGRLAHDTLNPLAVVSCALEGLELEEDAEQRAVLLARGRANIKRVQQIMDGLLKFACAGAHPEPGARADVAEVLAELEGEFRAQAAESGIEFKIEPVSPCSVACSSGILISLLTNLVQNAIKYLGDRVPRRIIIRVGIRGPMVRFEVEDTGPGLPDGFADRAFYPYVRAHGSAQPGIGLGLATVKKAAEAHGGRVGAHSLPGRGSLFFFEIPRLPSS